MVDAEPTYNGKMRVTTPPKRLKRIVPTGNCYFTFACPLGALVRFPCGGGTQKLQFKSESALCSMVRQTAEPL